MCYAHVDAHPLLHASNVRTQDITVVSVCTHCVCSAYNVTHVVTRSVHACTNTHIMGYAHMYGVIHATHNACSGVLTRTHTHYKHSVWCMLHDICACHLSITQASAVLHRHARVLTHLCFIVWYMHIQGCPGQEGPDGHGIAQDSTVEETMRSVSHACVAPHTACVCVLHIRRVHTSRYALY